VAKRICTVVGIVFILVGLAGFAMPGLLGTHLGLVHNVIHLVSGALALYFGLAAGSSGALTFCRVFGAVYLLLGVVGFALGDGTDRMFEVIPGQLMLGTMDHVVHIALGAVFLIGGFALGGARVATARA
jgi:Domain of unknown function (DUF4383)